MADRTSAGLFAMFFEALANDPAEEHKAIARKVWRERVNYDFSDYQMDCNSALIKLGLAREVSDDDGPYIQYAKTSGRGWEES